MEYEERLNNLKKQIFYEFLDMAGRVMVLVKYSPDVVIGNRGFIGEEKESGIILVFNPKMKFTWDEYGISTTLVFGAAAQKCFIPAGSIEAVYSAELNAQFVAAVHERQMAKDIAGSETGSEGPSAGTRNSTKIVTEADKKIISVDFVHKKKLNKDENE
jgi:hypothetical protein